MNLPEETSVSARMVITAGDGVLLQTLAVAGNEISVAVERHWQCEPSQAQSTLEDAVYEEQGLFEETDTVLLLKSNWSAIVPRHLLGDDTDAPRKVMDMYDLSETHETFLDPLGDEEDNMLLYTMPAGMRPFLERCFPTERVSHRLVPFFRFVAQKAANTKEETMWVDVRPGNVDVAAFRDGKLVLLNSWRFREASDAAGYLSFAWRTLGFDAAKGKLMVSGEASLRAAVIPLLRRQVNYVATATLPRDIKEPNSAGVPLASLEALKMLEK